MADLIGRNRELNEFKRLYISGKPEFVAVYGRRRVGKTFLVDEALRGKITFRHAGLSPIDENGRSNNLKQQLGMRGYFTIDKSDPIWASDIAAQAADGRVYLSMKKPVTTSIPVAPEAEQQLKPEVRKVMYDGKIYILRGDEVYTITGHRVK